LLLYSGLVVNFGNSFYHPKDFSPICTAISRLCPDLRQRWHEFRLRAEFPAVFNPKSGLPVHLELG
jgi:hypothetical protein